MSSTDTQFKPGRSGNPGGRPKGSLNKRTKVAIALDAAAEDVTKAVIAAAKDGDMQAAKLCLDRIQPPLRNEGPRVQFEYDRTAPLVEQAQQVFTAIAKGECDVDTGKILIECLTAFARLKEVDDLAIRVSQLEEAALAGAATQGVLGRVMLKEPAA